MVYIVYNIQWDTDDDFNEDIELPATMEISVNPEDIEDMEIDDYLCDEISNRTGFCHFGFNYSVKE